MTRFSDNKDAADEAYDAEFELPPIRALDADMKRAALSLGPREARYLVDTYYTMQEYRIAAAAQARALKANNEPNAALMFQWEQMQTLERQAQLQLQRWAFAQTPGRWAQSIVGIGPVISAGLLAHINIRRCSCDPYAKMDPQPPHECPGMTSVGKIWRFAGLDPTVRWGKGEKIPWNAKLKTLCWKIGESFVKVSNHPEDIYGKVYQQRKVYEIERNTRGDYADQAAHSLETKNYSADTNAYKAYAEGKLPDARIHLRAKRYAVKLFLSHLHHVMYEDAFGVAPPKPYILTHEVNGIVHSDYIAPPNWPLDPA